MKAEELSFDRTPRAGMDGWPSVPWTKEWKLSKRERSIVNELLHMYEEAGYDMDAIEDMAVIFGHDRCQWVRPIAIRFHEVVGYRDGTRHWCAQCMMVNRWRRVKRSGRIEDAFI